MTYDKVLIGVVGKAGHGKDAVCQYIAQRFAGAQRIASGDYLKEVISEFTGVPLETLHGPSRPEKEALRPLMQYFGTEVLRSLHEKFPDLWPKSPHAARLVRTLRTSTQDGPGTRDIAFYIAPDVRYLDEAEEFKSLKQDGWVVQFWGVDASKRLGQPPATKPGSTKKGAKKKAYAAPALDVALGVVQHTSETELEQFFTTPGLLDAVLDNNGDLDNLYYQIEMALIKVNALVQGRELRQKGPRGLAPNAVQTLEAVTDNAVVSVSTGDPKAVLSGRLLPQRLREMEAPNPYGPDYDALPDAPVTTQEPMGLRPGETFKGADGRMYVYNPKRQNQQTAGEAFPSSYIPTRAEKRREAMANVRIPGVEYGEEEPAYDPRPRPGKGGVVSGHMHPKLAPHAIPKQAYIDREPDPNDPNVDPDYFRYAREGLEAAQQNTPDGPIPGATLLSGRGNNGEYVERNSPAATTVPNINGQTFTNYDVGQR